jgi:hypothetical protein
MEYAASWHFPTRVIDVLISLRARSRFKLVREYIIVYTPEIKPLWVVAVFHGRRSPPVMAAILRGRE